MRAHLRLFCADEMTEDTLRQPSLQQNQDHEEIRRRLQQLSGEADSIRIVLK